MLCPLTNEELPSSLEDVGVIYGVAVPFSSSPSSAPSPCGCTCTLSMLVEKLAQHGKGVMKCPVCSKVSVISVCDAAAKSSILSSDEEVTVNLPIIAFRYGPQVFWLHVGETDEGNVALTQNRVANVLGMNTDDGLKILHRGKVLFPDDTKTPEEISKHLLTVTQEELAHHKKPSLVVMGKRVGHWGSQGGHVHR